MDVGEILEDRGLGRVVVFEVTFSSTVPWRDESPLVIAEDLGQKLCENGIVFFDLFAGVDVIVIVIHDAVCVVPALDAFGEIFAPVFGGVALLGAAEDNQDLVLAGDFDLGISGLAIDEDVAAIETFAKEFGRLFGEGFDEGIEEANRSVPGDPAKSLSGPAIVPEAFGGGIDVGLGPLLLQFLVEPGSVNDMAKLVNEDALNLHPSFVLHHILLGEEDDMASFDLGEKSALTPVVEIEFLARLVTFEFRQVGSEFLVPHKETENFFLPDAFCDVRSEIPHHLVEEVGGFLVSDVRNVFRGSNENVVNPGCLGIKTGVEVIFFRYLRSQRFDLVGLCREEDETEKEEGQVFHMVEGEVNGWTG